MVIAINKIDLYDPDTADQRIAHIMSRLPGSEWLPVVKISGSEWLGLPKLLEKVMQVQSGYGQRIATPKLNNILQRARITSPPRFPKNKMCKWKYITQIKSSPPVFMLSVNNEAYANFSFKKWVQNIIRKNYGFAGVPIFLQFSSKVQKNPYLKENKTYKEDLE